MKPNNQTHVACDYLNPCIAVSPEKIFFFLEKDLSERPLKDLKNIILFAKVYGDLKSCQSGWTFGCSLLAIVGPVALI